MQVQPNILGKYTIHVTRILLEYSLSPACYTSHTKVSSIYVCRPIEMSPDEMFTCAYHDACIIGVVLLFDEGDDIKLSPDVRAKVLDAGAHGIDYKTFCTL